MNPRDRVANEILSAEHIRTAAEVFGLPDAPVLEEYGMDWRAIFGNVLEVRLPSSIFIIVNIISERLDLLPFLSPHFFFTTCMDEERSYSLKRLGFLFIFSRKAGNGETENGGDTENGGEWKFEK